MPLLSKTINFPKHLYYETHLNIVNSLFPDKFKLTPKEIQVLARFMSLTGDIVEQDRFGTSAKKVVKAELELSDGGLGNYMKALKTKGFLRPIGDTLGVHPALQCDGESQEYFFKIVKTEN